MEGCPFCRIVPNGSLTRNNSCFAIYDNYPVTKGHTLVISKRHVRTYFDLTQSEKEEVWKLVEQVKEALSAQYSPTGFNVGFNAGETAGQTVLHCHIHVIPRYHGDMDDPRGGVRGVIPAKQKY